MKKIEASFELEKSTKNKIRFAEVSGEQAIETIYIHKDVIGDAKKIKVTIEVIE